MVDVAPVASQETKPDELQKPGASTAFRFVDREEKTGSHLPILTSKKSDLVCGGTTSHLLVAVMPPPLIGLFRFARRS